jgi:hypothetical protein
MYAVDDTTDFSVLVIVTQCKESLHEHEGVVIDFSESYSFTVYDAVQVYRSSDQVNLHAIVICMHQPESLFKAFCGCMTHVTSIVFQKV